jgi:hypothetical protein
LLINIIFDFFLATKFFYISEYTTLKDLMITNVAFLPEYDALLNSTVKASRQYLILREPLITSAPKFREFRTPRIQPWVEFTILYKPMPLFSLSDIGKLVFKTIVFSIFFGVEIYIPEL